MRNSLLKGLEEEVYTGTPGGRIHGLSHRIAAELEGFSTEPDSRNVEFTTAPHRSYPELIGELMVKRCRLRRYLEDLGYTLIPGGTLSLEPEDEFHFSNPNNPYYTYIRDRYGTRVVTASTHINVGIEDTKDLLRAYRVLRCEASLFLALTAASPFLAGQVTGYHSTRWHRFPKTPASVPFFVDHSHFVSWMQAQIAGGAMQNTRHLWLSIRPNGPKSPHELNRLELRICDRISDPLQIAAVTALFEARVWQVLENPELDPLAGRADLDRRSDELQKMALENEEAVARSSLEAQYHDWRTGTTSSVASRLGEMIGEALETAARHGFADHLTPVDAPLKAGNLAQKWLRLYGEGHSLQSILSSAIRELAEIDHEFDPNCPCPAALSF